MEHVVSTLRGSSLGFWGEGKKFIANTKSASRDLVKQTRKAGENFIGETKKASRYFVKTTRDARALLARGVESEARNMHHAFGQRLDEIEHSNPKLLTLEALEKRLIGSVTGIMAATLRSPAEPLLDEGEVVEVSELDEVDEDIELPIADYDSLNAKIIVSELDELNDIQVQRIHDYELEHKRRVTVLRATNIRLS